MKTNLKGHRAGVGTKTHTVSKCLFRHVPFTIATPIHTQNNLRESGENITLHAPFSCTYFLDCHIFLQVNGTIRKLTTHTLNTKWPVPSPHIRCAWAVAWLGVGTSKHVQSGPCPRALEEQALPSSAEEIFLPCVPVSSTYPVYSWITFQKQRTLCRIWT